ncbi:LPS assembly lipoprotein LptE [Tropicimonas sp. IMCC34043]|uniref:LPS assembly lipoprotein LptE n=1 Tax=Tropicimonas sp. IMCC34043 TaxID=2248760 RepID=UPI000E23D155|nr:LPS assembly lipoprotein LptE [Tropicimonas sp. IMCC34043]
MSWSDRRSVLAGLGATLAAAGCGFSPVYGPQGTGTLIQGKVRAATPSDRIDFLFASAFEDNLGGREDSPLELRYTINVSSTSLAITQSQSILRYHLRGNVSYQVVNRATGAVLNTGFTDTFVAYSAVGTTVATNAQKNAAYIRLMDVLAEQVATQLLSTAGKWAK